VNRGKLRSTAHDHLLEDLRDALGWQPGIEAAAGTKRSTRPPHGPADWLMSAIIVPPDLHQDRPREARRDMAFGQQGNRWSVRGSADAGKTAAAHGATMLRWIATIPQSFRP